MRYKRETLQDMTRPLKQWLYKNKNNPYPNKGQKVILAEESKMSMTQVSNWFANARRRLKNTVRGNELSWEARVSMYNECVKGNQETMDIESDDSAWESGEDDLRDSPMADPQSQSDATTQPSEQPTTQTSLPTIPHVPKIEPQSTHDEPQMIQRSLPTERESISCHIEKAIHKELLSLKEDEKEPKPIISKHVQDIFENVQVREVKYEPVTPIKEEPIFEDQPGLLPNTFPVAASGLSQKEQQLLSSNVSPLQHLNPTLASRLSEPIKSESLPVPPPVTTETMAANITNQIASYLMATSNMASAYPVVPFGCGQLPCMTPQMKDELLQHILLMQAHAETLRKQQTAVEQLHNSSSQLPAAEQRPNTFSPTNSTQSPHHVNSSHFPNISPFLETPSQTHPSLQHTTSDDVIPLDTHELAPSPAQSDDLAYPKSETPKFKNTLLQRYLQGDRTLYMEQPQTEHPVAMVTPLNSPNHQHHSFSPLDLRKRVRNLSGSMGSQDYEDISECETDVTCNGMMSPHHVTSPRAHDVTQRDGDVTSVFDELAKRWQEVNRGVTPSKDEEEKDDLMLKEVSAIFTLANLATSRTKATQQS